jgi:hypothetical protein
MTDISQPYARELARQVGELEAENERLRGLLESCKTILGNMALENEGAVFNRWPINHEPLRADARGLLSELAALDEQVAQ